MEKKTFDIPAGCKKLEIDFENKTFVAIYEPEKWIHKRGGYIHATKDNVSIIVSNPSIERDGGFDVIAGIDSDGTLHIAGIDSDGTLHIDDCDDWLSSGCRKSTPEEVELLDKKLLEAGYAFNKQTLELEKVVTFEDKEPVLVRDSDSGHWELRAFRHIVNGNFFAYKTFNVTEQWNQCTKYDPDLLGTTNKPKQ